MKKTFDGTFDGGRVKVIVKKKKDGEDMVFAKPKDEDVITLDFRENKGILSVHQDSADGRYYRRMENPEFIGSGILSQGENFVHGKGLDVFALPMKETADGFIIDTTPSGVYINLPVGGYCLMAFGKSDEWQPKCGGCL